MQLIHNYDNVIQVFIFTSSVEDHQKWSKKYKKIKGLSNSYEETEEQVREAIELNDTSLALGCTKSFGLLKEVVDKNIGKKI